MKLLRGFYRVQKVAGTARKSVIKKAGSFVLAFALCFLTSVSSSCGVSFSYENVSLVTWNVQTFFDAVDNGCEYSDFRKNENWNKEKYCERLERLCNAMKELDADVFVLEEIESEAVVHDICNRLAGSSWNMAKAWNYSCFAKPEGSAIGCAVLSRFKLSEMKVHDLDVRVLTEKQPSMRYLMQLKVNSGCGDFVLMVCHWKSKSGGAEETEIWRDWNENVLACRLLEVELNDAGRLPVVVCGDFNRDIRDFVIAGTNSSEDKGIILRCAGFGWQENIEVFSPWFSNDGNIFWSNGSYYYKNEWEYIDQIFCSKDVQVTEFEPCIEGPWVTDGGIPFSYKIKNGKGYSDHLPLRCKLNF